MYVSNPSPFNFSVSRVEIYMLSTDHPDEAIGKTERVNATTVQPGKSAIIHFQDDSLDIRTLIGSRVKCDGIGQ